MKTKDSSKCSRLSTSDATNQLASDPISENTIYEDVGSPKKWSVDACCILGQQWWLNWQQQQSDSNSIPNRNRGDDKRNKRNNQNQFSGLSTKHHSAISSAIAKKNMPHRTAMMRQQRQSHLQLTGLLLATICCCHSVFADDNNNNLPTMPMDGSSTTPMISVAHWKLRNETTTSTSSPTLEPLTPSPQSITINNGFTGFTALNGSSNNRNAKLRDSIFMLFARRFSTGNDLWDDIIRDCYERPSFTCFQKNIYSYLSGALETHDVNVTQRLKFFRNTVKYEYAEDVAADNDNDSKNDSDDNEVLTGSDEHLLHNEIPHTHGRSSIHADLPTPIEEVTNALYGKSVKFAMTHDMELKLPEMMFDGATFRISPKHIEGNGIIAKLELIPKQEIEARFAGKILKKKIQKFLRNKVLLAFIALVLIIKIIKIKFFWLLPIVIGVGAAKKLLLKFLLFLFPALSHLFKLCSHYQQTYHSTKYHHHHHLINHHHTVVPAWHNAEHNHPGPELIYTHPPKGHISAYLHGAPIHETYGPPSHEHSDNTWENSGPGLGSEYISDINRIAQVDEAGNAFVPNPNDANELQSWGLGTGTQPSNTLPYRSQQQQSSQQQQHWSSATQQQRPPTQQRPQQQISSGQLKLHGGTTASHNFNPFTANQGKQSLNTKYNGPRPPQSASSPVYMPQRNTSPASPAGVTIPTAVQIAAQYDLVRQNPQLHQQGQQQLLQPDQQLSPELNAQLKEAMRIQAENRLITQQQRILDTEPFVQDGQPIMPKNYDPFYSPILQKIDKIVEQLGVADELCKERLICSMYKDPSRYSPHSNFVSAELSRETTELEPVKASNPAVVRFYRLIQAARDGQEQKDCLRLYPQCVINTE